MLKYLKLEISNYNNIYTVGDIHGCYDLLMTGLKALNFNFDSDLLISVGDLVDRGDKNLECLRLTKEKWFRTTLGNHEYMALQSIKGNEEFIGCWLYNGGSWYLKLNDKEKEETLLLLEDKEKFPTIIEINVDNKKIIFSHADYPSNEYEFNKEVDFERCIWSRKRVDSKEESSIKNVDLAIFGHTPHKNIKKMNNILYIDTGVVFNFNDKFSFIKIK